MGSGFENGHQTVEDWTLVGPAIGLFALLAVWSLARRLTGRGARLDE
jgi:hypothetical protein